MTQPPTWAGRSVPDAAMPPSDPKRKRRPAPWLLAGLAGLGLLGAGFAIGRVVGGSDDPSGETVAANVVDGDGDATNSADGAASDAGADEGAADDGTKDADNNGDAMIDDAEADEDAAAEAGNAAGEDDGEDDGVEAAEDENLAAAPADDAAAVDGADDVVDEALDAAAEADNAEGDADDAEAGEDEDAAAEQALANQAAGAEAFVDGVPVRVSFLKGGVLTLTGAVPDQAFGEEIARRAEVILGEGNVINEYVIDERAPGAGVGGSVIVQDLVLFAYNSTEVTENFEPLLALGTNLLQTFDTVTIDIVTHTDADGSAANNLRLSQARGDAIRDYWVDLGIDPARLTVDARGESDPIADNLTEEGKQLNRRGEFIITGLLG